MADHRRALGLNSTYYTCTGDYPSNFIISDPGENYWNIWYTMTLGTDGYLRWAWDNFLYDMHGNVSYKSWEPGDCWFIYPVEREEVDMEGDCVAGFYSTPRFEMLKQGIRDVAKADYLMKQSDEYYTALDELTLSIERPQKGSLNGSVTYANQTERMLVHSETDRMYAGMNAIAEEYAAVKAEAVNALETAIETAESLNINSYTKETAAALAEALEAAKAVAENEEAVVAELEEAAAALEEALNALIQKKNVAFYADVTAVYTKEDGTVAECNQANASKITNGNTTDYWSSEVKENGSTVYIDAEDADVVIALDGTYSVEEIAVTPYFKNGGRRYAYNVYVSQDGENWELVAEQKLYDEEGNLNPEGTSAGYTYTLEEPKAASYVKIEGTGVIHPTNDTIKNLHLNEVMVYGSEIGNVALGKTVADANGTVQVNVTDGDRKSYWDGGAHADKPWIVVDLEGLYELDSVNVVNYFSRERYYQYELYVSVDGEEYTLAGKKDTTENETVKGKSFNFEEPVRASHIKVVGTYCSGNENFHLNELRAFGKLVSEVSVEVGNTLVFEIPVNAEVVNRNEDITSVSVEGTQMTVQGLAEGTASIEIGDTVLDVLVTTNKEALRQALASLDELTEEDYTVKSWKALKAAKEAAVAVNEDLNADAQQVAEAVETLETAKEALKRKVNVALHKPVTSSGNATTNRLDVHANDGDLASYWDAGSYEAKPWLTIDLEGVYEVDSIKVVNYFKNARFYHYEVYTSVDGEEYTLVAQKNDRENATEGGTTYVFEEPITAAYVKFVGLYNSANTGFHFNELEVFGEIKEAGTEKIRVACVGDSLTEGYLSSGGNKSNTTYPAYLQQILGDGYRVGNFGRSSMTMLKDTNKSYWDTVEFEGSLEFAPHVVIIMLGTNDSKPVYWDAESFKEDALALVAEYQKLPTNPRIIFAVSPQCFANTGEITEAGVNMLAEVQRALAAEQQWETIDMHELTEGKEAIYHADLVHFTDSGYHYIAQCMYQALTGETLPDVTDDSRDIPVELLTATAGDSQNGEGPERVLDGDAATLWHTDWYGTTHDNHWIQFEISEDYIVDGLRYQPRQNGKNGIITQYEVQVSDDAEEWTVVAEGTWETDMLWKTVSFEGQDVNYVRLVAKDGYTGNAGYVFASAAEIRLTGEAVEEPDVPVIPDTEICNIFTDVIHGAWYEEAVQYVYDEGIMLGDNGAFSPDADTSRAMVAMILYRLEGSPEVTDYTKYNQFTDVAADAWYADAVAWALNEGLATGDSYNMLYNPDVSVTREQLAIFLYRYVEYAGGDVAVEGRFEDLFGGTYVSDWAKEGFAWAIENGVIKGAEMADGVGNIYYDLAPQGTASRAQFATVLMRIM